MYLDSKRLNVEDKKKSNFFNWRGQFTPEFVEYILSELSTNQDIVVDPFCGSGTVLQECAFRQTPAYGFEINPAAYGMAKFFSLSSLSIQKRKELTDCIKKRIDALSNRFSDLPLFSCGYEFRERTVNLLDFARELFSQSENKTETLISLLTLFEAESSKGSNLVSSVISAFSRIAEKLLNLPFCEKKISAVLCDARLIHNYIKQEVNLILTSPPYVNVFNYHQNHRAILEILGFDMLEVAASEFGSNRKNRSNRFKTVIQYCIDIEQAIVSFSSALKQNGFLIFVVGRESNVRGIPIPNSRMVKELTVSTKGFSTEGEYNRRFTNRFGHSIVEDILIFRRNSNETVGNQAVAVAVDCIRELSAYAGGDILENMRDAISQADSILPSKLLTGSPML